MSSVVGKRWPVASAHLLEESTEADAFVLVVASFGWRHSWTSAEQTLTCLTLRLLAVLEQYEYVRLRLCMANKHV